MTSRNATLYIVFGVLLILAAPIILVTQLLGPISSRDYSKETKAFITEPVTNDDGNYFLTIAFSDTTWSPDDESSYESTSTDEEKLERTSDSASSRSGMVDQSLALKRFKIVETDSLKYANMHVTMIEVNKEDAGKYRVGDSVLIAYEPGLSSSATILNKAKTKGGDTQSWMLVSGLLFVLGIFLVRMGRRSKSQAAEQDVLSNYTSSTYLNKKDPPHKGGRP